MTITIGPHATRVRPDFSADTPVNRILLLVSMTAEVVAGAGLIIVPSALVGLLVGGTLDSPAAFAVARLAGAALVTLGLICWFASRDPASRAAAGIVASLVFYNAAAVCVLLYARLGLGLSGLGIWPAIVLHAALAAWCIASLGKQRSPVR